MNKYQLKKQSAEQINKYQLMKLQRKGEDDKTIDLTDEIKPEMEKGLKPIIHKSIKQQFNDDSNQCLYGLIQLLLDKEVISNEEYLKYCLHIQSVKK